MASRLHGAAALAAALCLPLPTLQAQTPCTHPLTQPTAAGPFGQDFIPAGTSNAQALDVATNRSGETVYAWRVTTAIGVPDPANPLPAAFTSGETFSVYCQRAAPDGSALGAPILVAANVFDANAVRAQIMPPAFPNYPTWGPRVRCDIDDFGTVVVAWDHIRNFVNAIPVQPVLAPRVRVQYSVLDFDAAVPTAAQDLDLTSNIVDQIDVDVAIGPDYPGAPTRACFVYSADFGQNLTGVGALPIRANIELATVAITGGPAPAIGLATAPVIVNTQNLTGLGLTNSWGLQYTPAIDMDDTGRAAVVWAEYGAACSGSSCNQVRIRMRRFLVGSTPAYTGIQPLAVPVPTPATDFVIDPNGWVGVLSDRPDVDIADDGRIAVTWVRVGLSARLATFVPLPTGGQVQLASDQSISTLTGSSSVGALSLSEEGSIFLATYGATGVGGVTSWRLHRLVGTPTPSGLTWSQVEIVNNVVGGGAAPWSHPTLALGASSPVTQHPVCGIAGSATGGTDVVWLQSPNEIDRTRFDANSVLVTKTGGGTIFNVDIRVPSGASANYILVFGLSPYYFNPLEDVLPDGRHSGTSLFFDPLTTFLLDPVQNPWFASFVATLDPGGCASFTINTGSPTPIGPLFASVVTTTNFAPFPANVRTFSTLDLVP